MSRFHVVDAAGTTRLVRRFFVVDASGVTRLVKRAFVIDAGGVARKFFAGIEITAPNPLTTLSGSDFGGQVTFNTSGRIINTVFGPSGNDVQDIGAWTSDPATAGEVSILATDISGTNEINFSPAGSLLNLGTTRTFSSSANLAVTPANPGVFTGNIQFDFYVDGAVVASVTQTTFYVVVF